MGYYSYIRDVHVYHTPMTKKVSETKFNDFLNLYENTCIPYVFAIEPNFVEYDNGERFLDSVEFFPNDETKAYDFDQEISRFVAEFYKLTGAHIVGDFIMVGEEFPDIHKYEIVDNGSVYRFKVKFDWENKTKLQYQVKFNGVNKTKFQ